MLAIVSLFVIVILSLIVTRFGAVALRLTGMSQDAARFQARSAFSGSGFTTMESEQVVSQPVRRKIIGILMLVGNIGIVAVSGTLIVSLVGISDTAGASPNIYILFGGLIVLYLFATSKFIDGMMSRVMSWALCKYTELETRDFVSLLHLQGDYQIAEIKVRPEDSMSGQTIGQASLKAQGVLVLGVVKLDNSYHGAPDDLHVIESGQTLVIYGLPNSVHQLDCRCAGGDPGND